MCIPHLLIATMQRDRLFYGIFTKLESLLYEYGSIRINMPFREMTKTEVAKLGLELNAPIEITYSCQVNSDMPCGACPNCVDRINAINNILEEKING